MHEGVANYFDGRIPEAEEDSNVVILETDACHRSFGDEQKYLYFKSKTTVKQRDVKVNPRKTKNTFFLEASWDCCCIS